MNRHVTVVGGGPAGASAAIAAVMEGASVELQEKSRLPRHKVCGEFLSPEVLPLLDRLGLTESFDSAEPARIRRLSIRFGKREKTAALPETAYGLSRFAFDRLLFDRASSLATGAGVDAAPLVIAHGRRSATPAGPRGNRLFGFKTHFTGPASDAIELHFFDSGYVGISSIENGRTNVCGLTTEAALSRIDWEYDRLLDSVPSLSERVRPLTREMRWLTTGPLIYGNRLNTAPDAAGYYAGDALSFVDPFTGSGMYCAVLTGIIAGQSAARGLAPAEHIRLCRQALGRPFAFASLFRNAVTSGWAERLAPLVPARWLYHLTRPRNPGQSQFAPFPR